MIPLNKSTWFPWLGTLWSYKIFLFNRARIENREGILHYRYFYQDNHVGL